VAAGSNPPPDGAADPTTGVFGPFGEGSSPFDFVVPGLIVGVPIVLVVAFILLQIAGGAAWLPVVRRWLARRI
jgi:hypothetical protein